MISRGYKNLFKKNELSRDNLLQKPLNDSQKETEVLMTFSKSLKQRKKQIGLTLLI